MWFLILIALLGFTFPASAAPYPTRTVEIVVSYGAGGSTDFVARQVAQKLQERLGQSFVVINRPGASGTIGIQAAMRAAPDGYTLYVGYTSETVVVPQISKNAKYSVVDDFEPIAVTGLVPVVLMVSKNVKADTLQDFLAEVHANPGKYTYGGGYGSPPHVMGAWMNKLGGSTVRHTSASRRSAGCHRIRGRRPHRHVLRRRRRGEAGNRPGLGAGAGGHRRHPLLHALPGVPTFKEAGVPEFDLASWNVMLAPKGTPAEIVALLKKETLAALDDPKVKDALAKYGVEKVRGRRM